MSSRRVVVAMVALSGALAVGGSSAPAGAAPPGPMSVDLSKAFNRDCVGAAYRPLIEGDCPAGGFGATYIAEKFPKGRTVLLGVPFVFGPLTGSASNAAHGSGQVLPVKATAGYRWLHVLASSVNNQGVKSPGTVTVAYANGKKTTSALGTYDWTDKEHEGTAAIACPIQNFTSPAGTSLSPTRWVWVESVPISASSAVRSVTLNADAPLLRVFAMTLSATPARKSGAWKAP